MAVGVLKTLPEFQKAVAAPELTVVDFFATWCGPCKMISPVIENLSTQFSQAHFYKVDVDESPEVSQENGITAMPTLIFFKNGAKVGTVVGANIPQIKQIIEQNA